MAKFIFTPKEAEKFRVEIDGEVFVLNRVDDTFNSIIEQERFVISGGILFTGSCLCLKDTEGNFYSVVSDTTLSPLSPYEFNKVSEFKILARNQLHFEW